MGDLAVDVVKLIKAVARDTRTNLGEGWNIKAGRGLHPKYRDKFGNTKTLVLPLTSRVDVGCKDVSYFISVEDKLFLFHTIYTIAYTLNYENPYIWCLFYNNRRNMRTVLLEANTYKILKNTFTSIRNY